VRSALAAWVRAGRARRALSRVRPL